MRRWVGSRRDGRRLALVGILVGVGLLTTGCAVLDSHARLTIAILLEDHGDAIDVTTNPVNVTADTCGSELDCVEAYSTEEADYYRFASRDRAADYAATLADGFVIHYIVMDFADKNDVSTEHQRWAMERLAGTWQDYSGAFPDR
ncbi:hypothetical protein BH09ACT3_BH09ACT3_15620 [soil metagenome]